VTELAKSKTPRLAEFLACRIPSVQVSPILPFGRCSFRSSHALLFFEGVTKIVRWNAISVKILNSHVQVAGETELISIRSSWLER
jgi:hypothetical protein